MARVTLTQAGEDVIVGGADVQVIGTPAGGEVITVVSGNIRLDPSFNQGGDTIVLPGNASDYTAYRAGGEVIFTRNDGGVTLRIPIGSVGTEIQFNGGDSRTLLFDATTGQATLEGQALGTSSTSPTPITANPGGPAPVTGYTIDSATTTSVVEGDNGTRLLVYTITLSRAVTAADGPLTLNYQTQDGTASSASDYVAAAGQVTFAVGQSVATVAVVVNGDVTPEANETVNLRVTGGTLLNNQPVVLTGTIINDDAAVALTGNADNFVGSSANDGFFAANGQLGAGDKITDASTTDNDTLTVSLDGANTLQNVGGFALTNIETLLVTNDDTDTVTFDLSSSKGIQTVGSVNSSNTVVFNQVTSAAGVLIDDVTGPDADVQVIYQDGVLAGATTINVTVNDANFDDVILGGVTNNTAGIETVVLNVSGTSTIDTLVTDLQSLTIQGGGKVTLDDALNTTIRTINASNAGSVNVNFSNNDLAGQAVTFTGSAGNDTVRAGLAADIINGGAGNDSITNEGGNDVINGGAGDDVIVQQAAGDVVIDAGTGTDTIRFDTASLDLNDKVTFDGTAGDTLVVSQALVEGNLVGVSGATNLTVLVSGTTDLGSDGTKSTVDLTTLAEGQRAGIQVVNLNLAGVGGGNDTLLATDYTSGLTVNLGAFGSTDTVKLGSGNDTVRTASFDNADVLEGNKGVDAIVVTDGANSVTAGNFKGFETITYLSDADGDDQTLTVNNANAPTDNGVLTVDASALVSIPAVPATSTTPAVAAIDEQLTFDSTAVSAYKVDVTGGAAADNINTNNAVADTVRGLGGADVIVAGGDDTVDGGAGKDTIILFAGDNIARGGDDEDTIRIAAGVGNNTVLGEGGNDRIEIVASADLTKLDTIDGGAGSDTISVQGTFVDAQFTGLFSVETLETRVGAVSNVTIGAEAQEGGIRTVNLLDLGADVLNASAYTADLTVTSAGGDDNITTGTGSDTINLGVGTYTIATGAGDDRILASGNATLGNVELDYADTIKAGAGNDSIVLDNTKAAVTAQVNLGRFDGSTTGVSGVENFTILANGQTNDGKTADVDNNVLTIGSTNGNVFDEVTVLNVDASALTDQDDSFRLVIDSNLTDDDVAFKVTGSSTTTIVEKLNLGIDNNINFIGGTGADILRIDGADAGSTVTFNGTVAGADDQILQTGGVLSDDGFVSLTGVEVLTGDVGTINATLGNEADEAGINRILGTTGNDKVTLAAGFNNATTVVLDTGADTINGAASSAAITFIGGTNLIQADDTLSGGSTAADVITLNEGGSSNLSEVSQVETINVVNSTATVGQFTTITLDATAAEVNGRITINSSTGAGDALVVNATNNVSTGAGAAAGIIVNGGSGADLIQTGGGNDTVNGGDGADQIRLGAGNDTANGGAAVDTIRGELGDDTLNGDAGNDLLYGDFNFTDGGTLAGYIALGGGNDTLNGGEGNDTLVGGLGRDTLTGGLGADTFRYQSTEDSRFTPSATGVVDNRDRITDFNRAEGDKIDLSGLTEANGQTIRFNGNYATFGEAQSAISSTSGGGFLDAVYVQESDTLYVDVNNDGVLNGDDLQIILQDAPSTFTLTGADINAGSVVGAPPVVVMAEMDMMVVDHRSLGMNTYDSVSFA